MSKAISILVLLVFLTCCNSAVVKQKLKDQIREGEEKEQQQKVKIQILDNDEEATTAGVVDPPIQHQFANVVQSGVGQVDEDALVEETAAVSGPPGEVEDKSEKPDEAATEKEKEDEDEDEESTTTKPKSNRPLPNRTTQQRRVSTTEKVTDEDKEEEDEKAETTEASGDSDEEEEDEAVARKAKGKLQLGKSKSIKSADCGYHRLKPGEIISVTHRSLLRNNTDNYSNRESCVWKFFGHHCVVKTSCPCFDLPASADCVGDYLKLSDMFSFAERFCGDQKPSGMYNSTTNHLLIRFTSHFARASDVNRRNFTCYVSCTGPGRTDPPIKSATCPAG